MKLLANKKDELNKREKHNIKDLLEKNKIDEARIRVEYVIKDDDYIHAINILGLFCEKVQARLDLIETSP